VRRPLGWALLALLGVVLAAAAAYAANQLATQPVGLSAEPITAGDRLAPKATRTPRPRRTPTPSPTAPPATPVPTVDDSGHGSDDSGGGGHGGHGSDD
jgi:hypothetical protein